MNRWLLLVVLLGFALSTAPVNAQIGTLKRRTREAVRDRTNERETTSPVTPAQTVETATQPIPDAPGGALVTGVAVTRDPSLPPPALAYFDLLNAFGTSMLYRQGRVAFTETHHGVFLPAVPTGDRSPSGSYTTMDGPSLAYRVVDASGMTVHTVRTAATKRQGPFFEMQGSPADAVALQAGDYALEWLIEGEPFYRFPFTIRAMESGDAYNPEPRYQIDGPWRDYLVLNLPNDARHTLEVGFWVRDDRYERDRASEYWYEIDLKKDGRLVGVSPSMTAREARRRGDTANSGDVSDIEPWWEYHTVQLWTPVTTGAAALTVADLSEGTYTLTYTLARIGGDEVDAGQGTFEVRGGKVQPQGRQAADADPLTRIEGGDAGRHRHYYFIERR